MKGLPTPGDLTPMRCCRPVSKPHSIQQGCGVLPKAVARPHTTWQLKRNVKQRRCLSCTLASRRSRPAACQIQVPCQLFPTQHPWKGAGSGFSYNNIAGLGLGLDRCSTFSRPSRPTCASVCSPSASTRMDSEHLAASTRLILPLNLGCDCPIRLAW